MSGLGINQCSECGNPYWAPHSHACSRYHETQAEDQERKKRVVKEQLSRFEKENNLPKLTPEFISKVKVVEGFPAVKEPAELITIDITQYEGLLRKSRQLKAIQDMIDEYHISRKMTAERISEDHLHRMRRKTLSKISQILQKGWNG